MIKNLLIVMTAVYPTSCFIVSLWDKGELIPAILLTCVSIAFAVLAMAIPMTKIKKFV